MKRIKSLDLIVLSILAVVCSLAVLVGFSFPLVRILLGFLLVFILPGYAFLIALFPDRTLGIAGSLLITFGASIMITALSGVFLNLIRQPIQAQTWALILSALTLAGCIVSGFRRRGKPQTFAVTAILRISWRQLLIVLIAVAVTVSAVSLATLPMTDPTPLQGYTILWILPDKNTASNTVHIGMVSNQFKTESYRLQLKVNGNTTQNWPSISLAPGQSWETTYSLPINSSSNVPVEAFLYRLDSPKIVYRQVKLLTGN